MCKIVYSMDWVIALYVFNLVMVSLDLILYFKYIPKEKQAVTGYHPTH